MKKIHSTILLILLPLLLVPAMLLQGDISRRGLYRLQSPARQMIHQDSQPLRVTWYLNEGSPYTAGLERFFLSLPSKVIYRKVLQAAENFKERGALPYSWNEQDYYSAVLLERGEASYWIPQILDPGLMEERLTAALTYLQGAARPQIALLSGDWRYPLEEDSSLMTESLKAYGEPRILQSTAEIGEEQIILIAGHRDLTVLDLDRLQRFREQGRSLLILASPFDSDPKESDRLDLRDRSLFMEWLENQGLTLEPYLLLDSYQGLPLADGSPYAAWILPRGSVELQPFQALWASPISLKGDWTPIWALQPGYTTALGGQLGSLAPSDLRREPKIPMEGEVYTLLAAEDSLGKLALIGSRWSFSDLILQSGSMENLEVLNGLVLLLSDQEKPLEYRSRWKRAETEKPVPMILYLLPLLLSPWWLIRWARQKKRRTPPWTE